jgi:hypothetical protein
MSAAAFSAVLYLVAGLAIAVWLAGQERLPRGFSVRSAVVLFWPAYLPVCLSPKPISPHDPAIDSLRGQIDRLPIDPARRSEYRDAVERLAGAVELEKKELARLLVAEERLLRLGGTLGGSGEPLVEAELVRVRRARQAVDRDLERARQGMLKLALRLELIDLEGSGGKMDEELASLEEEIGRLLDARDEVARLAVDL